jgi:hypothetical protein
MAAESVIVAELAVLSGMESVYSSLLLRGREGYVGSRHGW